MNINYKLSNSTLHDEKSKAQKKTQTKTKFKKKTEITPSPPQKKNTPHDNISLHDTRTPYNDKNLLYNNKRTPHNDKSTPNHDESCRMITLKGNELNKRAMLS